MIGTTIMPKKETIERMRRDKRAGKSASTQAGELFARRSKPFARASTVRDRQSKRLLSASRRRGGLV